MASWYSKLARLPFSANSGSVLYWSIKLREGLIMAVFIPSSPFAKAKMSCIPGSKGWTNWKISDPLDFSEGGTDFNKCVKRSSAHWVDSRSYPALRNRQINEIRWTVQSRQPRKFHQPYYLSGWWLSPKFFFSFFGLIICSLSQCTARCRLLWVSDDLQMAGKFTKFLYRTEQSPRVHLTDR